ncbi:hypothetical protein QL285_044467 [Trifolium repens]|nr:hypothetical protein QL285_044467 [Trifolium repens]
MGRNENEWCHYHRCKGHDTEKCFRLKDLIEELIRSGHLKKFIERAAQDNKARQRSPRSPRNPPAEDAREKNQPRIAVNIIAGGFAGGGNSNNARKRYVRKLERESIVVGHVSFPPAPDLSFSPKDATDIVPHDDDPLVIQVQILNCDVKRVLIDSGSSADIMYWDAFKAMQLSGEQLQPYHGTLVGFTGDQAEVMGYITLLTTFGIKYNAKTVKIRYLVVRTPYASYNIIIGRPAFNALGAAMSTLYLAIKYPLDNGGVGTIKGDQILARQCYESSLKIKKKELSRLSVNNANTREAAELDPREDFQERRVSPIEELEEIQIGKEQHQTTNIGTTMGVEEREEVLAILKENVDLFAWKPEDMPGIDETVITHKLAIASNAKPVVQRKRKQGEERRIAVDEEVAKLRKAQFIDEIKYPEWLANVVMVKKSNGKWRMCVDFTDLNKACPKDPYPLPSIDRLIDGASGYKTLSFMDAYSGYNQIKMSTARSR